MTALPLASHPARCAVGAWPVWVGLASVGAFGQGCAAILTWGGRSETRPFSGVCANAVSLAKLGMTNQPTLQWMNLLDTLFSLVADTLMLPFDLAGQKKAATNFFPAASNSR